MIERGADRLTLHVRFPGMADVERACSELLALGISRQQMQVEMSEHCPACAVTRDPDQDPVAQHAASQAQILGGVLGVGVALLAIAAMAIGQGGLSPFDPGPDLAIHLGVAASWAISGGILGSLVGLLVSDLVLQGRAGSHDHVRLAVSLAPELASQAALVISRHHGDPAGPQNDAPYRPEG